MANGANEVHKYLKSELENYIKSQYFGKSPLLLSTVAGKLDDEGELYQQPYIESSPAYVSVPNGIDNANIPEWMRTFFKKLADANLGVYTAPFKHQINALETAIEGKDLFVATGTGSGKTECFMWPMMAKLTSEAGNTPETWKQRGVRVVVMYPMNALVSDQISRLRRLMGDEQRKFVNIFRETAGGNARRPQFGMYTGRTPYVQQPLYSTLPESETMENVAGYKSLRMASRTNQRIIMVNKGAGGKGFMVCPDCGAAMPGDDPSVLEKVDRPYITVPKFKCSHRDAENLNLGYDFVTDMLVLEISLDPNKVETDREDNLWVNRAGQSLAETIRLVVSRILDVEFTELMTGYRVRKNQTGAYIDVYIYDSLSSGAGYAVAVASVMPEVLERAEALLQGCDCENACYNCLKHYRNQNVHGMLDRFAALDLLNWAKDNSLAPMLSIDMQKKLLAPLGNVLKYADIILSANGDELSVKKNLFHKALKIYPAMWKKPEAKDTIYISDACVKYAKPSAVKKIIDGL